MVIWSVPLLIVRGQPLSVSVDDGALSAAALTAGGGGSVRVMVRCASSLCAQEAATVSPVMIKLRSIRFIFLVSVPSITRPEQAQCQRAPTQVARNAGGGASKSRGSPLSALAPRVALSRRGRSVDTRCPKPVRSEIGIRRGLA